MTIRLWVFFLENLFFRSLFSRVVSGSVWLKTLSSSLTLFARSYADVSVVCMAMKSEIVEDLLKIMFRKFSKTKIIVFQNVNFMLNLLNSYDGSRRRRHRQQSHNSDQQSRRHRKAHHHEKTETVRVRVSRYFYFYFILEIPQQQFNVWSSENTFQ